MHVGTLVYDRVPRFAVDRACAHQAVPRPVLDREQRVLLRRVQADVCVRSLQNN